MIIHKVLDFKLTRSFLFIISVQLTQTLGTLLLIMCQQPDCLGSSGAFRLKANEFKVEMCG